MLLPIGITQQAAGGSVVYAPGMMTFNGPTAYYSSTPTTSGNLVTLVMRFNRASFTGAMWEFPAAISRTAHARVGVLFGPSNDADTEARNKVAVYTQNSAGTVICKLVSTANACDGSDHVMFYSFNGDTGNSIFYLDGVSAENIGWSNRVAPTTGTLDSGAASNAVFGQITGNEGYMGIADAYLSNPTDFYHPTNGLQELDEAGWTEFGSQPLFWNQYGTMTDNKGSAGNMTANGTITGPA